MLFWVDNHCRTFITFVAWLALWQLITEVNVLGLLLADPLQIIVNGLTTVHSKDLIDFLKKYMEKEPVECIVVGEPKRMNNEASDSARFIEPFVVHLKRTFPQIKVERLDERFTSKMAFQTMIDGGLKKKVRQNKELVDEI